MNKADDSATRAMGVIDAASDRHHATDGPHGLAVDIVDVVVHLRHLADRHGLDWPETLDRAELTYWGDVADDELSQATEPEGGRSC